MESVSTPNTTSNESNTNTTSITTSNNINEKGDLNSHAIYENGEFQLIEHLLHQQEIDKEATKEEEESKINLKHKTPVTNENDTEIVLVREEEHQQQPSSQFQASTLPPRYNQQNQPSPLSSKSGTINMQTPRAPVLSASDATQQTASFVRGVIKIGFLLSRFKF